VTRPVWLKGEGFITDDGRFWPESVVRAAILAIGEWWGGLSDQDRWQLQQIAHLAAVDKEIDAAVFGD
jgi:hypothetical protein